MKIKTTRLLGLSVSLVGILGSFQVASAERDSPFRECHAAIEVVMPDSKGIKHVVPITKMTAQWYHENLGPGGVSKARRRARDRLIACAEAFAKSKKPGLPKACKPTQITGKDAPANSGPHTFHIPKLNNGVYDYPKKWAKVGGQTAMKLEATYLQQFLYGYHKPPQVQVLFRVRPWSSSKHCKYLVAGKDYKVIARLHTEPMGTSKKKAKYPSVRSGYVGKTHLMVKNTQIDYKKTTMSKKAYGKRKRLKVFARLAQFKIQSEAFAPLGIGDTGPAKELLRARPFSYAGCGRHAAQHLLDFLGYPLKINVIGKHVKLHKPSMAFTKLQKEMRDKPVLPMDLRTGINDILELKKANVRTVISAIKRKDAQAAIKTHIKAKGPVIALVKNGTHYVTAMGHWQPLLDSRPEMGSFYTFSDGATRMYPHGEYNLQFNSFWSKMTRIE